MNHLKSFILKLSQISILRKITSRLFIKFPVLKQIIIDILNYQSTNQLATDEKIYSGDILQNIKQDIEKRRQK